MILRISHFFRILFCGCALFGEVVVECMGGENQKKFELPAEVVICCCNIQIKRSPDQVNVYILCKNSIRSSSNVKIPAPLESNELRRMLIGDGDGAKIKINNKEYSIRSLKFDEVTYYIIDNIDKSAILQPDQSYKWCWCAKNNEKK